MNKREEDKSNPELEYENLHIGLCFQYIESLVKARLRIDRAAMDRIKKESNRKMGNKASRKHRAVKPFFIFDPVLRSIHH